MPFTPKKLALLISSLYMFSPLALIQAADAVEQAESGEEEVAGD